MNTLDRKFTIDEIADIVYDGAIYGENDNLLLNENFAKIANFLWTWFKKGINPLNYVIWVWKNKGLSAFIALVVKISIIDTNMARWLLRSFLRLPTSNIVLTVRIQ